MKRIFLAMIFVFGILFFLLGGERTATATTTVTEKTRVEIVSNFSPLTAKILANGGDYVEYANYRPDCKLVINIINISNQRANATGVAIPGYAIVWGGGSEKFSVAMWGVSSSNVTFPIGNTEINAEHSSVAGIRLPTFRFVTANGFDGLDSSKVLEALKKWDPGIYQEDKIFSIVWPDPIPDCPEWGVFDKNDTNIKYASLVLVERSPDGRTGTFQITELKIPFRTLFGKRIDYY